MCRDPNMPMNNTDQDIRDLKDSITNIEKQIVSIDDNISKIFELINNITVFIEEADEIHDEDLDDEEDWTPYDDRNFSYRDEDDDDEYKNDDDWGIREDES